MILHDTFCVVNILNASGAPGGCRWGKLGPGGWPPYSLLLLPAVVFIMLMIMMVMVMVIMVIMMVMILMAMVMVKANYENPRTVSQLAA